LFSQFAKDVDFRTLNPYQKKIALTVLDLDDWGQVLEYALPIIEHYGPKAYDWLKNWWTSGKKKKSLDRSSSYN
jgi:hypothetical protein